jgi:anti-sigma regulatory factor (Ser/Thr protein kinase)
MAGGEPAGVGVVTGATPLRPSGEVVLVHQRLPGTPEAASRARRIVRDLDWPDIDTVILLTSEIVTNASRHSGSHWLDLVLGITADGDLRLQVIDEGRGHTTPHLRRVDDDAVAGRGLHLVNHYARRWGIMKEAAGLTVWCDIADGPPRASTPPVAPDVPNPTEHLAAPRPTVEQLTGLSPVRLEEGR